MLIGEFCHKICIGDHSHQEILCLESGNPIRVLFIDAVQFQSGWYHGLNLNYQARPDMCSGRAFLFIKVSDWHQSVLPTLLRSYPTGQARRKEEERIMTGDELRQAFLSFFVERGHTIIPSASLVPENDPSALFTSAGMQPLIPYLLGEIHPGGRRLVDVQKCLRTVDIEEVGDTSHNTFFEMLGFWSLGDYWKQDSLRWTLEWFTHVLGLEHERISVTVFAGDSDAPRDDEAVQIWLELGIHQ